MRGWKREVRAALAVPLPALDPPLPYDDPDVELGERRAVTLAQRAAMTVCELAGYHVFAFGFPTCRCGEQAATGSGMASVVATGSILYGSDPGLALDLEADAGDGALGGLVLPQREARDS